MANSVYIEVNGETGDIFPFFLAIDMGISSVFFDDPHWRASESFLQSLFKVGGSYGVYFGTSFRTTWAFEIAKDYENRWVKFNK